MVIITADDYGKTRHATDSILKCFSSRRITCGSAMVFMEDSERAAELALESGLEVGLHLNFTVAFTGEQLPGKLRESHNRASSYLARSKLSQIIYNPFLSNSFNFLNTRPCKKTERAYTSIFLCFNFNKDVSNL